MLTKEKKKQLVKDLAEKVKNAKSIIFSLSWLSVEYLLGCEESWSNWLIFKRSSSLSEIMALIGGIFFNIDFNKAISDAITVLLFIDQMLAFGNTQAASLYYGEKTQARLTECLDR